MTTKTPPATPDIARAERQGYASYINGRHPDIDGCPYPVGPLREAWLRGFRLSAASTHADMNAPITDAELARAGDISTGDRDSMRVVLIDFLTTRIAECAR